jgi:hypothetical protein
MNVFLGLVFFAAFAGSYVGGFHTGMKLTRPLKSQYVFSKALSSPRLRRFDVLAVWWLRILVALICGQVFSLPLWGAAVIIDHLR